MQIFKNCIESIKEKPIVYLVFLFSVIISVIVSCTFYRSSKSQAQGLDPYTSIFFSVEEDFNPSEMYKFVKDNKTIVDIRHLANTYIIEEIDGVTNNISINYNILYTDKLGTFSAEELDSSDKSVRVSLKYARDFNVDIGSVIEISGEQYMVIGKTAVDNSYEISFKASSMTAMPDGAQQSNYGFSVSSKKAFNNETLAKLGSIGLQYQSTKTFDTSALFPIIAGIFVMLLASFNVCVAFAYILKRNGKRYNVYKTVGAKNRFIYGAVATEVGITFLLGFAIGGLIEGFATKPFLKEYMITLNAIDYVAIAAINVLFIVLAVAFVTYRLVGGKPAENKRLSEV